MADGGNSPTAFYAAIVATASLAWNIANYLWQRPRLGVRIGHAYSYDQAGKGEPIIAITATNIGRYDIRIEECGFYAKGEKITKMIGGGTARERGMSADLPQTLSPGQSFMFWFSRQEAEEIPLTEPYRAYLRASDDAIYLARGREADSLPFLWFFKARLVLRRFFRDSIAYRSKRVWFRSLRRFRH